LRLEFRDARGDLVEPEEKRHRLGDRLAEGRPREAGYQETRDGEPASL